MSTEIPVQEQDSRAARDLLDALSRGVGLSMLSVDSDRPTACVSQSVVAALPSDVLVVVLERPRQSLMDFLLRTCAAFGVPIPDEAPSITTLVAALKSFLKQRQHQRPLLVVDEAQEAPFYVLWQLLSLIEPDGDGGPPLQVLLVGRPALEGLLARAEMAPVTARIEARCHLTHGVLETPSPAVEESVTAATVSAPVTVEDAAAQTTGDTPFAETPPPRRPRPAPAPAIGRRWTPWLMAGGSATALLAAFLFLRREDAPAATPVVQTHPATVAAAAAPAPLSRPTAATPQPSTEPAAPSLDALADDANATWGMLGRRWDARLSAAAPCEDALSQQLQCYRRPDMTLDLLRQLDRPGLVQLRSEGVTRWVHLLSMDERAVTLSSSGRTWTWSHNTFGQRWTGAYSTLWRLPPQQTGKVFTASADTPAGQWLDRQLKALQSNQKLQATEDNLNARVIALQKAQGWPTDGKALPTVMLLVNRLVGVPEPRLMGTKQVQSTTR